MIESKVFHSIISVPISLRNKPYEVHKRIWKAFVGLPENTPQPFTFRTIDINPKRGCFLVQSKCVPDWQNVKDIVLLQSVTEHIFELNPGDSYLYRIIAAPLVKVISGRKTHSRHVALQSDERIWDWFVERSVKSGIEVDKHACQFVPEKRNFRHPAHGDFSMTYVCFDGLLIIKDPDKLKHCLENGFSSKKAFGFGMMNLINPSQT